MRTPETKSQIVLNDYNQLLAHVEGGQGQAEGNLQLWDVWTVDPEECGGTIEGTFSIGSTPETKQAIYFTSNPDEDPELRNAKVKVDVESFALGSLKIVTYQRATP